MEEIIKLIKATRLNKIEATEWIKSHVVGLISKNDYGIFRDSEILETGIEDEYYQLEYEASIEYNENDDERVYTCHWFELKDENDNIILTFNE